MLIDTILDNLHNGTIMQDLEKQWKISLDSASNLVGKGGSLKPDGQAEFVTPVKPTMTDDLPAQFGGASQQVPLFMQNTGFVPPTQNGPTLPAHSTAWYKHTAFLQFATCIAVILVSFIILISIRPMFLYKKPKDKMNAEEFSSSRAFFVALGTGVVCGIIMFVLAMTKIKSL